MIEDTTKTLREDRLRDAVEVALRGCKLKHWSKARIANVLSSALFDLDYDDRFKRNSLTETDKDTP